MDEQIEDHLGMTDQQWATFQAHTQGFGEQDESGVDISMLRENLRLTPEERLQKHERALRFVLELRHAGEAAGLSYASTDP